MTQTASPVAKSGSPLRDEVLQVDMRDLGSSGLRRQGGRVYEEKLPELTGQRGIRTWADMARNDVTCGTILYLVDKLCRRVPWQVVRASDSEFDREAAEFVQQCMDDMDQSWIEFISEALTMLCFGFSVHEIVYKRRAGQGSDDPSFLSKYSDGRIGWRGLPMRSQDTLYEWHWDQSGTLLAFTQQAPPTYELITIPMSKALLFRTSVNKNDPEGLSIFRHAYRSFYMKKHIENIEAVGIERDLVGLPVAQVPPEILSINASPAQKAQLQSIKEMVTQVRRDEQEGIVMPLAYDDKGREMYKFSLLTSGGSRQFNTDAVIARYNHDIAMSSLADFLLLGAGASAQGSWAMHSDKTKMFATSIGAFLDIIAEVMNRTAIPSLMQLNDFQMSDFPKLSHAGIESTDLRELGAYIQQLAAAGMPMFPDEQLENNLREAANLPPIPLGKADAEQDVEPQAAAGGEDPVEVTDETPAHQIPAPVPDQAP